jgi:hypothetical protein
MEEYVWISKVTHHPVFTDRAHPVLDQLADHYNVTVTVAGSDDAATGPYVKAVYDAIQRKVAGLMVIGWGNDEMVPAIVANVLPISEPTGTAWDRRWPTGWQF